MRPLPTTAVRVFVHSCETLQADANPPSEMQIGILKRHKATRPEWPLSSFSKDSGEFSSLELTKLLVSTCEERYSPRDWCQSVIYEKAGSSFRMIHRNQFRIDTGMSGASERRTLDDGAGFRPGRGSIGFVLFRMSIRTPTFFMSTIFVFVDLRAKIDSIDLEILWHCFFPNCALL